MRLRGLAARLRAILGRSSAERDLDDELRYHLDRDTEHLMATGLSRPDAQLAARRAFGNSSHFKEQVRDAWGARWLDEIGQNIRFSLRGFRRAPGFVATVVSTIAIGLALNTTVFTIFNAYVLKPLHVRDPDSLYEGFWQDRRGWGKRLSWRQYQDVAALSVARETFAYGIAITRSDRQPLVASLFTGNAFQVLGATPSIGRLFGPADAAPPSGWPVIVLSHNAWSTKFGADSSIVGKKIMVHGIQLSIIGVAAPGFTGIGSVPPDFWAPITLLSRLQNEPDLFGAGDPALLRLVVRLKPDVSERQAIAALSAWGVSDTRDLPDSLRWSHAVLSSLASALALTPETIAIFTPAAVAFGLVLLIACVNVANVMLARGIARQREIGVRLALGAARARLIRQLLTESILLAIPAAIVGYFLSRVTLDAGVRVMFSTVPADVSTMLRVMPLTPDVRVFGFILLAALVSAVVFGLAPAIQATRPNIVQASRGDFDTDFRPGRVRGALIVAEVAICSLLLIVTGVLLRGADVAASIDPGIRTRDVVQLTISDSARASTLLLLAAQPSVRTIGASSRTVLDGIYPGVIVRPSGSTVLTRSLTDFVDSGFFHALDIPLVRGRAFTADEARDTASVVVVSQATADAMWPGLNPLGQTLTLASEPPKGSRLVRERVARVIGVVGNTVSGSIAIDRHRAAIYYPASATSGGMRIIARVNGDPLARERIDRALSAANPGAVHEIHAMDDYLAIQTWPFRAFSWISSMIGAIALMLTVIGIYGVLSYVVAQRTREIGIRMALGARAVAVVRLVVRQIGSHAAVGLLIGTVLALGVSRLVSSQLTVVDAFDLRGYVIGTAVVLVGAIAAAWGPARRASSVNPIEALRND
jgi:predicted permease